VPQPRVCDFTGVVSTRQPPNCHPSSSGTFSFTDARHGLSRALPDLNRFDEAIGIAAQICDCRGPSVSGHSSWNIEQYPQAGRA